MVKKEKITILVADDHEMVREGLTVLINVQPNFKVVGEASDGISTLKQYRKLEPDILLLDLAMPKMNGFSVIKEIKKKYPKSKIIILSMYSDEDSVENAFNNCVNGYLVKQSASSELIKAINAVANGELFISKDLSNLNINKLKDKSLRFDHNDSKLSKREKEILKMIARGNTSKDIGNELFISWKTVEKHRRNITNKLNIHNIAGLTRYAVDHNLIPIKELYTKK